MHKANDLVKYGCARWRCRRPAAQSATPPQAPLSIAGRKVRLGHDARKLLDTRLVATVLYFHSRQRGPASIAQRHHKSMNAMVIHSAAAVRRGHLESRENRRGLPILRPVANPPAQRGLGSPGPTTHTGGSALQSASCAPLGGPLVWRVDHPLICGHVQHGLRLQRGHVAAVAQLCHCKAACARQHGPPEAAALAQQSSAPLSCALAAQGRYLAAGTCQCRQNRPCGGARCPGSGRCRPKGCTERPSSQSAQAHPMSPRHSRDLPS